MIVTANVGNPTIAYAPGAKSMLRAGALGDLIVSELHGKYYEQAYRKNLFLAFSVTTAMSAVGTAMVGLQIWNQTTSVNLVIGKVAVAVVATSASATGVVAATGYGQVTAPTSQTAITRVSSGLVGGATLLGAASPQALATNAGTFTTAPTAIWQLFHNTAAIGTTGVDQLSFDFEGMLIIPPQGWFALAATGAAFAASAVNSCVSWEEVPV